MRAVGLVPEFKDDAVALVLRGRRGGEIAVGLLECGCAPIGAVKLLIPAVEDQFHANPVGRTQIEQMIIIGRSCTDSGVCSIYHQGSEVRTNLTPAACIIVTPIVS